MQLRTTIVCLAMISCSFMIRIWIIWDDWATGLEEGVFEKAAMLLYPLLQSEGSKKSSSTACIHSLSVPCGMLVARGSGTDLSAMLVATFCGLFWFIGRLEAQSLPSPRAQGNSWLLVYANRGGTTGIGNSSSWCTGECAWKVPLAVC